MNAWTTTPPTEPGWYWAQDKGGGPPHVVRLAAKQSLYIDYGATAVIQSSGKLHWLDGNVPVGPDWFSHWLGPLPVPEPPKE